MDKFVEDRKDDQEISLLDLLATIIRHRVWVFWTTGIGTFLAIIILFILPMEGINLAGEKALTLQAAVRVVGIPTGAQTFFNLDILGLVQAQVLDLKSVAEVYRVTLMTSREATLEKPAFNRVVHTFITKSIRVIPDLKSSTVALTVKVKESDQDKGTSFLHQFLSKIQNNLKARITSQVEQTISDLDPSGKASTDLAAQTRAPYEVAAKALRSVLADPDFPLAPIGEVEALEDETGLPRGALFFIFLMGSMIVGTLLAFAVEAVSRIQRDPEAVELLKKAWRGE